MKAEKKKLLISTDCFLPRWDGIARFLQEIIPRLSRYYKITVVAPKFEGSLKGFKDIELIRFPVIKKSFGDIYFSGFNYRKIKKIVKENDVVFNQTLGPIGLSAVTAAKRLKKPIVGYVHSLDWELASQSVKRFKEIVYFLTKKIVKRMYNKCDILLVPSEGVAKILENNRIKTKKRVVRLGTSETKFKPVKDKDKAKKKIGIDSEYKVIGFCGRIGREKNIETLYSAFKILQKKRDDIVLLIIGKGIREEEKEYAKNPNIILAGSVNNVVPYLQAMDIYVLPSLTETTSLATLEAMSAGLPVVVTPVGYIKKYVVNNYNGVIFKKRNYRQLAKKLERLLDNRKRREKLGRNARKTIIDKFNWEVTVKGVKNSIESALKSSE